MVFRTLVWKDFQYMLRSRMLWAACVATWALMLVAGILSWYQYRQTVSAREAANHMFRQQWEQQARDPHSAAHFGTYLFKPVTPGSFVDPGLDDYSGTTFRVEAHILHDVAFGSSQTDAAGRFGKLSLALVLQILVPLLIIVIAAPMVTVEREGGTLRLLLLQGTRVPTLLWSKCAAIYLAITLVLLPCWVLLLCAAAIAGLLPAAIYLVLACQLYYLFIVLAGITVSALSKSRVLAYCIMLGAWLLAIALAPRITTSRIATAVAVPGRDVFEDSVKQGYLKGLGTDGPYYTRNTKFVEATLQRYGVSSEDKLPVNIEGLVFQEGEAYKQRVYTHFYQPVRKAFDKQQQLLDAANWLNPYMAIHRFSMTLAGTSIEYHEAFREQAMDYRQYFIATLNNALAAHSPASNYVADAAFFSNIKPFIVTPPDSRLLQQNMRAAISALATWTLLAALLLIITASSKRLYL